MANSFKMNPAWVNSFVNGQLLNGLEAFCEGPLLKTAVAQAPASKARSKSEARKKPRDINFTGYRRGQGTLKKSARVLPTRVEGNRVTGGVVFTAPYAMAVHVGAGGRRGQGTPNQYLTRALDAHATEIENGSFLKGNR